MLTMSVHAKRWCAMVAITGVVVACKSSAPSTEQLPTTTSKADQGSVTTTTRGNAVPEKSPDTDWAQKPCDDPAKITDLDGMTADAIEARFGAPIERQSFRMGERQDEFRIELQNTYPLSVRGNETVEIQEWTWHAGDCRLTVWLHRANGQWTAFHNRRWNQSTDF